jgi:hypothetical protein
MADQEDVSPFFEWHQIAGCIEAAPGVTVPEEISLVQLLLPGRKV